jgi:putative phosphoribosyl transferase
MNAPTDPISSLADHSERLVRIEHRSGVLGGHLNLPPRPTGLILFLSPHGDEIGTPHHDYLAQWLALSGFGVLQMQLLNQQEQAAAQHPFRQNPGLLAERLTWAMYWTHHHPRLRELPMGCLGFGLGGTAALKAAGALTNALQTVVLLDSQPDLSDEWLPNVRAATLLLVSRTASLNRRLNEIALTRLRCEKELMLIPAAEGSSDAAQELILTATTRWFESHLRPHPGLASAP